MLIPIIVLIHCSFVKQLFNYNRPFLWYNTSYNRPFKCEKNTLKMDVKGQYKWCFVNKFSKNIVKEDALSPKSWICSLVQKNWHVLVSKYNAWTKHVTVNFIPSSLSMQSCTIYPWVSRFWTLTPGLTAGLTKSHSISRKWFLLIKFCILECHNDYCYIARVNTKCDWLICGHVTLNR